ncbi:hypothetical protein MRX96_030030 [Rhipicephalus microplus]
MNVRPRANEPPLRGDFRKAVRECHTLIATCTRLETFSFTSVVPSPFQSEPVVPLFFAKFAAVCANIRELDVRFETRGNLSWCDGCENESSLVAEFRNCTSPAFPNGLARLTLSYVRDVMCRWFIKCCCPMATLRLSYCHSKFDFGRLCSTLADSTETSCFILQHHLIWLDDVDLLTNLCHLADLRYLYLLSETSLSPNAELTAVTDACQCLPQMKCLHVNYQDITDPAILKTITWLRRPGGVQGDHRVIQDGLCFQGC